MTRNQCNLSGRIKQSWVWIIVWILKKKNTKKLGGKGAWEIYRYCCSGSRHTQLMIKTLKITVLDE